MAFRDPCKVIRQLPIDFDPAAKVRPAASSRPVAFIAALILAVIAIATAILY